MDPITDGCRLCLDPFAESFTTIDNPQLKVQMEKVFCFSIEPTQGYCSGVCQNCSYVISEFYQYSEKVCQNQDLLKGNVTNFDQNVGSNITLERIKAETFSVSEYPETTEEIFKLKNEVFEEEEENGGEEVPTVDSKITLERIKAETFSDSEYPETTEDVFKLKNEVFEEEEEKGGEEVPTVDSKITLESVKVKALSDCGHPEITQDACEPKDEVSEERKIPSGDDEDYADEPTKTFKQNNTKIDKQKRIEEDQLFNKHFRMICDLCGTSAATYTELRSHFRKEHKIRNGYVVCCNKKLFSRKFVWDHLNLHANPDAFRCEVCGIKYKNKDTLNDHMLYKHSIDGAFMCNHCPQSFAQKSTLVKHMKRHEKVECLKCNKMFANKESLRHHRNQKHSDKPMKKQVGIEEQRIQCVICQRWLKGQRCLRDHMNFVHSDIDQELQCDVCLKKYRNSRKLYLHKALMHGEPKHECEFCGMKFRMIVALREHRTIHTGEGLYTCEYCGVSKNNKPTLWHHIRRHHSAERAQQKLMATQTSGSS